MITRTYDQKWHSACYRLGNLLPRDKKLSGSKPIPKPNVAFRKLAGSYINYCFILNELNDCYKGTIHPDKKIIIRKLMETTVGRILELKWDLVSFECTDYNYIDAKIFGNQMTRYDIEIHVPAYYREDREDELEELDSTIERIHDEAERALLLMQAELAAEERWQEEGGGEGEEGMFEGEWQEEEEEGEEEQVEEVQGEDEEGQQKSKRPEAFKKIVLTPSQIEFIKMVGVIQKHERARTCLLQIQIEKEKRRIKHDIAWLIHKEIPPDVKLKCAEVIGRYWRRYQARRHRKYLNVRRDLLLGAACPSYSDPRIYRELEAREAARRREGKRLWKAMEDATLVTAIRMERDRAEIVKEGIVDELLYFIRTWYEVTREAKIPEFPDWPDPEPIDQPTKIMGLPKGCPEDWAKKMFTEIVNQMPARGGLPTQLGGSALIVAGHWITPEMYVLAMEVTKIFKEQNKGKAKKKPTKEELKQKAAEEKERQERIKEAKRKKLEELRRLGFMPLESKFLGGLLEARQEYKEDWRKYDDSEENPRQQHLQPRIDEKIAMELHMKMRAVVDEMLLLELQRLDEALKIDCKRIKMKTPKKKRVVKKKKKKGKGKGKKGKGKKGKDLTKSKTKEQLFEELVKVGIIIKCPRRKFEKDIPGEFSYSNAEKRKYFFADPEPCLGDMKQVIKEYCVLPLGSKFLRESGLLPQTFKSVLIAGPRLITKLMLECICSETGAVLFRLDPNSICSKYKKKMLVHILTKVPKLYEPAILWLDGAEKPFYKKVPKAEKKFKAKALKGMLPKILKAITPQDRILLVGTTDSPWLASGGLVAPKMFEKVLACPMPDVSTVAKVWYDKLMSYHSVERDFPVIPLAAVTLKYPLEVIEETIGRVLTAERIIDLKRRPLEHVELIDALPDSAKILASGRLLEIGETPPQQAPQSTGVRAGPPGPVTFWEWAVGVVPMYIKRTQKLAEEAELRAKLAKIAAKKAQKKPEKPKTKEQIMQELLAEMGDLEPIQYTRSEIRMATADRKDAEEASTTWRL